MKQIPLLQGKALLIELPEGAYGFRLFKDEQPYLSYWIKTYVGRVNLSPGTWQIVGMLMNVSVEFEDKLEKFVDECDPMHADDKFWWDYQNDCYFDESMGARDTIESAIRAEGYMFENKERCPQLSDYDDDCFCVTSWKDMPLKDQFQREKWKAAQSRVLDRSRCLLLGREI